MYKWDFSVVENNLDALFHGVLVTINLTAVSLTLATILGLILCLGSLSKYRIINIISTALIEIFRAAPALIVLIWVYYALPVLIGINLTSFVSAILALTVVQASYEAEIFRAGIQAIDRGQTEAARSLGMTSSQAMRRIVLPQAVRIMVPPFVSATAGLIKYTSLASVVSVYELLNQGTNIIQQSFRPLEVYTAVAVLYLAMIIPITLFSRYLEKRFIRA